MDNCNAIATPLPTTPPLAMHGTPIANPTEYRGLIGSLQYLSLTQPGISFTVLIIYKLRRTIGYAAVMHLIYALLKFLIFPQTLMPRHARLTAFCYDSLYNFFFCINIVFSLVIFKYIYNMAM